MVVPSNEAEATDRPEESPGRRAHRGIRLDRNNSIRPGRGVMRFESDPKTYVPAHHWTCGWYERAVNNPDVRVEIDGTASDYTAVPVQGEEFERVAREHPLPLFARFLVGFPPLRPGADRRSQASLE